MRRLLGEIRMSHKAKYTQPVINGNGHNSFARHALAVIAGFGAVACDESTAEEVNHDGEFFIARFGRCPDVEIQAVLAHSVGTKTHVAKYRLLHATRTKLSGFTDPAPFRHRLRLHPP